MNFRWSLIGLVVLMVCGASVHAETQAERDARMKWWREARFGMFVHWGLYAIPAGQWDDKKWDRGGMEWIQKRANVPADVYADRLLPQFKPKQGFAAEWAELAKVAGCKYVVFTDKHHEGFALHDSKVTGFDAKDVTGRDLTKEIVEAVKKQGLRIGMYYSLWDWHHPDAYAGKGTNNPSVQTMEGRDPEKYLKFMHEQVDEIASNYGRVDVLWFDYSSKEVQGESWKANELLANLRKKQPGIIVNNRLYRSPEAGWHDDHHLEPYDSKHGDFTTPEQRIPPNGVPGVDWETCMTMNTTWGYSQHDHNWKTGQTLIRNLVDICSKGGNYLLNIGPMADGTVPPESVQLMYEIGAWMQMNGEAIYGTTASPFKQTFDWGRVTVKGDVLYLHVFDWPADKKISIPPLNNPMKSIAVLGDPTAKASLHPEVDKWVIQLPDEPVNTSATVIKLQLDGDVKVAGDTAPMVQPGADGTITLAAHDALTHGKMLRYEPQPHKNTVGYWVEADDYVEWNFQVDKPGEYEVIVYQGCGKGHGGSEAAVHIGGKTLNFTVEDTGGFQNFVERDLGTVNLSPGDQTLSIKPIRKAKLAVMDVRRVTLKRK
ncbi:alpha-L-fucosidase [Planctomycetales bacterium ZRK34]|nr:alpha-L-fucosidase [Planctomycetales bacterium ZRK34]